MAPAVSQPTGVVTAAGRWSARYGGVGPQRCRLTPNSRRWPTTVSGWPTAAVGGVAQFSACPDVTHVHMLRSPLNIGWSGGGRSAAAPTGLMYKDKQSQTGKEGAAVGYMKHRGAARWVTRPQRLLARAPCPHLLNMDPSGGLLAPRTPFRVPIPLRPLLGDPGGGGGGHPPTQMRDQWGKPKCIKDAGN